MGTRGLIRRGPWLLFWLVSLAWCAVGARAAEPDGEPFQLDGHINGVRVLQFTADGKSLISGGFDGVVRVWNLRERRSMQVMMAGGEVRALALSPDGKLLAAATSQGTVRLWLLKYGTDKKKTQVVGGRVPRIMGMGFMSDNRTLATGFDDGVVRYVDVLEGKVVRTFTDPARERISVLAVLPESDAPVVGTPGQKLLVLDGTSGQTTDTLDVPEDFPSALAASQSGGRLAVAAGAAVRVFQPGRGVPSAAFLGHSGLIESVALSRDGLLMATCGRDHTVRRWETTGGEATWKQSLPEVTPLSVAISPEGTWLACGDSAGRIRVWKFTAEAR